MKKKQIAAALFSALMLTGCQIGNVTFNYIEAPESDAELTETSPPPEQPEPSGTSETSDPFGNDETYEKLYDTLNKGETHIELENVTDDENPGDIIRELIPRLEQEHPELFWLSYSWSASTSGTTVAADFSFYNDINPDELPAMRERFDQAVNAVISQIPAGASDFDKIVFVHDWLVNNTRYDYEGKDSTDTGGLYSSAYGPLVNGSAVCAGYSDAFLHLMNKLGIEAGVVSGYGKGGSHSWNYVRLDGEYYWVDVTWDDPTERGSTKDSLRHHYLMITDDLLMRTHTVSQDPQINVFIPTCTGTKYNYYRMTNSYIEHYSKDAVFDVINAHPGQKKIEVMFGDYAGYKEAIKELFDESKIFDIATPKWDGGVSYQYNDEMYILTINLPIPDSN